MPMNDGKNYYNYTKVLNSQLSLKRVFFKAEPVCFISEIILIQCIKDFDYSFLAFV